MGKLAYSLKELTELGPFGRSFLYKAISTGELPARKAGRRTVVLVDDFEAYLRSRPLIGSAGLKLAKSRTSSLHAEAENSSGACDGCQSNMTSAAEVFRPPKHRRA